LTDSDITCRVEAAIALHKIDPAQFPQAPLPRGILDTLPRTPQPHP
jgi:hypothetical protein